MYHSLALVKRLPVLVGVALVATTLVNGAAPYLKRVGILRVADYEAFWHAACAPVATTSRLLGVGRQCKADDPSLANVEVEDQDRSYLYQTEASEIGLKLAKDVVVLLFMAAAVVGVFRSRNARFEAVGGGLLVSLLALILLVAALAVVREGWWPAVTGLRAFSFLPVALAAALVGLPLDLGPVAASLLLLLLLQVLLAMPEMLYGLHVYGDLPFLHLPRRLAGSLIFPNSLGVFAGASLAFHEVFGSGYRRAAYAAALVLAIAAGSATGLVAVGILGTFTALNRVERRRRTGLLAGLLVVGGLAFVTLPTLLSRPDIFDSVWGNGGRLDQLAAAASGDVREVLFGRGLGSGTNTSLSLEGWRGPAAPARRELKAPADSTVTLLVRQTGLVGLCGFCLMLAWAWKRDPKVRPFYLVVSVCSLTMNVTELFPVNFLLGLALGHSLLAQLPECPLDAEQRSAPTHGP